MCLDLLIINALVLVFQMLTQYSFAFSPPVLYFILLYSHILKIVVTENINEEIEIILRRINILKVIIKDYDLTFYLNIFNKMGIK